MCRAQVTGATFDFCKNTAFGVRYLNFFTGRLLSSRSTFFTWC